MYLPVAHAEGKFVPRDAADARRSWTPAGQLVLRYGATASGDGAAMQPHVPYPDNPNGSPGDVAGVCDATGRVCGLMPHPERHIDPTQHPRWTRGPRPEAGDGLRVFQNAVELLPLDASSDRSAVSRAIGSRERRQPLGAATGCQTHGLSTARIAADRGCHELRPVACSSQASNRDANCRKGCRSSRSRW